MANKKTTITPIRRLNTENGALPALSGSIIRNWYAKREIRFYRLLSEYTEFGLKDTVKSIMVKNTESGPVLVSIGTDHCNMALDYYRKEHNFISIPVDPAYIQGLTQLEI